MLYSNTILEQFNNNFRLNLGQESTLFFYVIFSSIFYFFSLLLFSTRAYFCGFTNCPSPKHFKQVKMSAIALLKMVMHARSGDGTLEVMGIMMGKVQGDTIIVMDAFALPVHGTETRVNAGVEANEYMVEYISLIQQVTFFFFLN